LPDQPTVAELVGRVAAGLRAAGIEAPRVEARLIVAEATGLDRARQLTEKDRRVDAGPALALAHRRAGREPMAYILGRREFWGLDFDVGPGVLVPRPETETLIEAVLATVPDRSRALRLADLGTGSGCLLLTLLTLYPNAIGIGIDRSARALDWAARNRTALGLATRALLIQGNWLDPVRGPFDLVVANPPYIAPGEPRDPETRHEPESALLAGADGLAAYRAIAPAAAAVLHPNGLLVLEIGAGQVEALTACLEAVGFSDISCRKDLAGWPRAVVARRTAPS
jgi:release factor glutamine methyltransferase